MRSPRLSCAHCMRPYLQTDNEERARSGDDPGLEKEAVKEIEDMNRTCVRVFEYLKTR